MNNTVDNFFNAKENISDNKTLFEIKQHYNFHDRTLHVFVEANDDFEFYRKSIEYIYRGFKIIHYAKKGKKYVLSSYDVLNWNLYNKSRILFFVDKDYEDILGISSKKDRNIFVTKFYSIENYISSKEIFKYSLEELFKIKNEKIVNDLVKKFENSFKVFENHMVYLTSIILIYRRNNEHMDLSNLKMDDFFTFKELDIFKLKYRNSTILHSIRLSCISPFEKGLLKGYKTIDCIKKTGADISKINSKIIIKNIKELKCYNDSRFFIRGKYQLWFFIKCISNVNSMSSKINADIQRDNVILPENEKIINMNTSININENNIFDILPMKIDKHNDVNVFLINNLQQLNE
jgi:hypothetical protein